MTADKEDKSHSSLSSGTRVLGWWEGFQSRSWEILHVSPAKWSREDYIPNMQCAGNSWKVWNQARYFFQSCHLFPWNLKIIFSKHGGKQYDATMLEQKLHFKCKPLPSETFNLRKAAKTVKLLEKILFVGAKSLMAINNSQETVFLTAFVWFQWRFLS